MSLFSRFGGWAKKETTTLLNTKEITATGQDIKEKASFLNPFKKRAPVRDETFQNSMSRFKLSADDLIVIYNAQKVRFYIALVFSLASVLLGIYFLSNSQWWGIGPAVAAISVSMAQMFNASFRAYQIKRKEWVNVSVWWNNSSEWFPDQM